MKRCLAFLCVVGSLRLGRVLEFTIDHDPLHRWNGAGPVRGAGMDLLRIAFVPEWVPARSAHVAMAGAERDLRAARPRHEPLPARTRSARIALRPGAVGLFPNFRQTARPAGPARLRPGAGCAPASRADRRGHRDASRARRYGRGEGARRMPAGTPLVLRTTCQPLPPTAPPEGRTKDPAALCIEAPDRR
jgi:hypothetical protein